MGSVRRVGSVEGLKEDKSSIVIETDGVIVLSVALQVGAVTGVGGGVEGDPGGGGGEEGTGVTEGEVRVGGGVETGGAQREEGGGGREERKGGTEGDIDEGGGRGGGGERGGGGRGSVGW